MISWVIVTPVSSRDQSNQTPPIMGLVRLDPGIGGELAPLCWAHRGYWAGTPATSKTMLLCPLNEEFIGEAAVYCSVFKKMYVVTNMHVHICSLFKKHRLASPMSTVVDTNATKFCGKHCGLSHVFGWWSKYTQINLWLLFKKILFH